MSNEYKEGVHEGRQSFYVNELFRYMEVELSYDVKGVEIQGNTLIVKKIDYINPDQQPVHHIKLEGDELVIKYYKYGYFSGTNNIIRDVEEFRVSKTNNYIFIMVKLKRGKVVERCLGIKYVSS
jgi:hypothetical protein